VNLVKAGEQYVGFWLIDALVMPGAKLFCGVKAGLRMVNQITFVSRKNRLEPKVCGEVLWLSLPNKTNFIHGHLPPDICHPMVRHWK